MYGWIVVDELVACDWQVNSNDISDFSAKAEVGHLRSLLIMLINDHVDKIYRL